MSYMLQITQRASFAAIVPGGLLRQARRRVRGNMFTILCWLELKLGFLFYYLSCRFPISVHEATLDPIALAHTKKNPNTSTTKQDNIGQKSNVRVAVINPTQVLSSCLGVLLSREFTTNTA